MKERLQNISREIAAFFTSPIVLKNLGLLAAAAIGLLFITSTLLRACTRHGESLEVQDFVGLDLRDAMQQAERSNLRITVLDSVDRGSNPPNIVISQNPIASSKVKKNRNIYLTVTSKKRELTKTPRISANDEFNRYKSLLKRRDLNAIIKERVVDRRYAKNTILKVFHGDDELSFKDLDDGYEIEKGSTLEFVITEYGVTYAKMPDIICNPFAVAAQKIRANNLVVGAIEEDPTVTDRASAHVYQTVPALGAGEQIQIGQQITLYLTQDLPADCGGTQEQ